MLRAAPFRFRTGALGKRTVVVYAVAMVNRELGPPSAVGAADPGRRTFGRLWRAHGATPAGAARSLRRHDMRCAKTKETLLVPIQHVTLQRPTREVIAVAR